MYVCLCQAVTERQIEQAVDSGARCFKDLRSRLRVATVCGRCASCAQDCLRQSLQDRHPVEPVLTAVSPRPQPLRAIS